jgi:signal transduction histidine kinase/CheY-like chemotaxis protein
MERSQQTILIIDDSLEDRETYRRYLFQDTLYSYQILEAECGEKALTLCESIQPDAILLDYLLPDLNGLEFIEALKIRKTFLPPTIILTGHGNEAIAVQAMKSGAQDYLIKRCLSAEFLLETLTRVLEQNRLRQLLEKKKRQEQLMGDIALRIRQTLEMGKILDTAVHEIRLFLECDRVLVYQFAPDMSGTIVAESVQSEWQATLGKQIVETCFQTQGAAKYQQGYVYAIDNIYRARLSDCHLELLKQFQVQANLVVPILLSPLPSQGTSKLWGLLVVHQCSRERHWQTEELELLDKLAVQLAIALQQAELLEQLKKELSKRQEAEINLLQKAEDLEHFNQKLVKTKADLEERNHELKEFAYVISHDLRAPLRAIANLSEWLAEDLGDLLKEETLHHFNLLQGRISRMQALIEALLQYSRIGRTNVDKAVVAVEQLLEEVIDSLAPPLQFTIEVASGMPTFTTEQISLQQVFANLIDNAIKYHHRQDGRVKISVRDKGKFYEFAIADDGPGIAPEYHQKIFAIFQTLHSKDVRESSGIGLSIVKKIVELQGGKVTLVSQLGQGSTFYFTWRK